MAKKYDESDGIWRTVGGRRIFIRNDQTLADAMKESGKFKREVAQRELFELEKQHKHKGHPEYEKKLKELKDIRYTSEQLKEKYGTDDVDLINAGKAKEDRVSMINNENVASELRKADNWSDINKTIDNIKDEKVKEMMKKEAQKLEENENGAWKSSEYLAKQYNFYNEDSKKSNGKLVSTKLNENEVAKYEVEGMGEITEKQLKAEYNKHKNDIEMSYDDWKYDLLHDERSAIREIKLNEDEVTSYSQWKKDYGTNIAELEKDLKLSERYLDEDSEGYREAKKSLENGRKYLEDLKKTDKTIKSDQTKYRNEFEEYKRKHPNTDLSLADYIKIKHAGVGAYK